MLHQMMELIVCPKKVKVRVILGVLVWLIVLIVRRPDLSSRQWGEMLLALAAVLIVPMGLAWMVPTSGKAYVIWRILHGIHLPAGILLLISFLLETGIPALLLAVPWCAVLMLLATLGLIRRITTENWAVQEVSRDVGAMLTVVAAAWLLCDRVGYRPLGFDEVIVLLTAIHFHYAAFALPLCAGLLVRVMPFWWLKASTVGILISVLLVAAGITVSHLTEVKLLEIAAAGLLSMLAAIIALGHLLMVFHRDISLAARWMFMAGAIALLGGMVLSGMYAMRYYVELPVLDIPFMRKWHGTLGAVGFAPLTLLAWYQVSWPNARDEQEGPTKSQVGSQA